MTGRETEALRLLRAGFSVIHTAAVMGVTLGVINGMRFRHGGMVVTPMSVDEIAAARAKIRGGARPAKATPKPPAAKSLPPLPEPLPDVPVVAVPKQDDPWSDADIAALREMWGILDISASEIGRRLEKSKDSITGKAHRLDLPPRTAPIIRRDPDEPAPVPHAAAQTLPATLAMTHARDIQTPMQPIGRAPRCQFPMWSMDAPRPLMDPKFCGEPSAVNSYCLEHARRCYTPHPVRRGDA